MLVLSTSQAALDGFYPTLRTTTSTDTTPVSGSGTVTDDYGNTWDFAYDGTATTTTTTTTRENLPYTDTAKTLYVYAYNQQGGLISSRWRTITTRRGGDGMNTLGYNLGALLRASIDTRGRLLGAVVKDVYSAAEIPQSTPAPEQSSSLAISDTPVAAKGASEADFPLTAVIDAATQTVSEEYLVSAQIGDTDYYLDGPRLDLGRYAARFSYKGQDKLVEILDHDPDGNPVTLTYQIYSEQLH
ncbi:MAG: hypothetical protein ACRD18_12745 [Terriglobia bacterium]